MTETKKRLVPPYMAFLIFNATFFMMDTMASYFHIYLNEIGLNRTRIGLITGTASFFAMICQPFFGAAADGCKSKNRMLQGLILVTSVLYPLILKSPRFVYILVVYTVFCIFRRFQPSLNTTMSVEYAEQSGRDYGPIRMMGAVGYTAMMMIVSRIAGLNNGTVKTFYFYSIVCLGNVLILFLLPTMKGHNTGRDGQKKVSPLVILKNRPVMVLILYQILLGMASGISMTYFSIFAVSDMGMEKGTYGLMVSVGSLLEIPFLFLADRLLRRFGVRKVLLVLGLLTAFRWGNAFFARSTWQLFISQGCNFVNMTQAVAMAILLSRRVQPQLKTSVQTLSATIQNVVSIVLSSFLGGFLADHLGIRPLFGMSAVLAAATAIFFFLTFFKNSDICIPDSQ